MRNSEYNRTLAMYNSLMAGEVDFDDFYNGWLDDHDNQVFNQGFNYAIERIEEIVNQAHKKYESFRDSYPVGWDEYRLADYTMHSLKVIINEINLVKKECTL